MDTNKNPLIELFGDINDNGDVTQNLNIHDKIQLVKLSYILINNCTEEQIAEFLDWDSKNNKITDDRQQ